MHAKRQVLFVQGGGAGVHDEWDAKLVESLKRELGSAYEIRYPQMPHEGDPRYATWKIALEEELAALDEGAILIGHSLGGTVLVNALAEKPTEQRLGGIFLIAAPFVGDGGWSSDELKSPHNLGARLPHDIPIHLFHGVEDEMVPPSHAELYARTIPQASIHCLPERDHQLNENLEEVAAAIQSLNRRE